MFPGNSTNSLVAVCSVLPALALVAISLRFYARHVKRAPYRMDDWIMLPALVLLIVACVLAIYSVRHHDHGSPSPPGDTGFDPSQGMAMALELSMTPALGCTKLGYLLFYRRLFCTHWKHDLFAHVTLAMMVVIICWTLTFEIMASAQCVQHDEGQSAFSGTTFQFCRLNYSYPLSYTITDVITDLLVILVPIPRIWSLKMSHVQKVGVSLVFSLGLLGFAASIARMVNAIYLSKYSTLENANPSVEYLGLSFWGVTESGVTLIAVNLPSVSGLVNFRAFGSNISNARVFRYLGFGGSKNGSNPSQYAMGHNHGVWRPPMSSETDLVFKGSQESHVQSLAIHELEAGRAAPEHLQNPRAILVKQSILQIRDEM